ncbi:flagellar motor protein MotA [Ruegeria sp. ANG-R]|uniref:MotA/TolQ/ExbB proton channel family protein n=1 Tax=Ruegeria sp. ANG-R TaxID=1577903 RepID=UPI00057E01CB|nr:MotA/TolQ/ExbB proton channel family protein [Ruegeria sp. ANG-R]KIC41980.1 flagellar motor protein MotA [Ruegeria sp. ANG-R]
MTPRMILVAALAVTPTFLAAQETQPAPEVSTQSPALAETAPSLPETPIPTPAPDGTPVASEAATANPEEAPVVLSPVEPLTPQQEVVQAAQDASADATAFLRDGGPSIWAIAALSVITVALILWKIWRLALIGAWSRGKAGKAVDLFESGQPDAALATVAGRRGIRSRVVAHAIGAIRALPEDRAREETARVAKREIAQAGTGLRALELIATIAPLLGLLGTVLGMIAAFQALQQSGNRADPALLAGGIWEALLTTAAGMAVAIPASAALTWFEAVIDRIRRDVEDGATRLFVFQAPDDLKLAAE